MATVSSDHCDTKLREALASDPILLHEECVACHASANGFAGDQGVLLTLLLLLQANESADEMARVLCFLHRRVLEMYRSQWPPPPKGAA